MMKKISRKNQLASLNYVNISKKISHFSNILAELNVNFNFTRPLTVTGAYLMPGGYENGIYYDADVFFHQMVLDHIDNPSDYYNAEYVIKNTSFQQGGSDLRIPKTRGYYVSADVMANNQTGQNEFKYYGPQNAIPNGPKPGDFMWLMNEQSGMMQPNTWYLLPQAYSIILVPE